MVNLNYFLNCQRRSLNEVSIKSAYGELLTLQISNVNSSDLSEVWLHLNCIENTLPKPFNTEVWIEMGGWVDLDINFCSKNPLDLTPSEWYVCSS